jgi:transposase-like protein
MEERQPAKVQHQKSYPVEFKLQVLDWYYSNGKNKLKTATHFNIHTKRIRDWELNEAFLRAHRDSPRRRFRMEKAAADTYGNIGKSLFQWYVEEKALGTDHTFGDLKSKAVQLATEQNVQESFTVSDSWVRRWKKKYGVEDGSRRRAAAGGVVLGAGVCEEGIVEVETGSGNIMDTGEHGDLITIPTMLHVEVIECCNMEYGQES